MPPKQKQARKGPSYKTAILSKDLVPTQIKEPPRQLKSLKYPEAFPDVQKNDKKANAIFQAWPSQQTIKAFDFGLNSQNHYDDPHHQSIAKHLKNSNIAAWKSIPEIIKLKAQNQSSEENKNADQNGQQEQAGQQEQTKQPLVIETFERDQTHEEMETRLKEEAQKAQKAAKDKKKGKKQEPKQEGPIKVRDVKMANIKIYNYMADDAIWVGSQLQIIKLRNIVDAYNKEPVWKKIYPQQNGVPQLTKSGKYWVKLYYMGQPIKIQIDDRLPINHLNKELFPTSQKKHQKWTLLITKALIKYLSIACPQEKIPGSGVIVHALTGMVSQSLSLKNNDFLKFKNLLSDKHYVNKDIFVECFTKKLQTPPSNIVKRSQNKQFILQQQQQIEEQERNKNEVSEQGKLYQKQQAVYEYAQHYENPIPSNIILNHGYLLGDYFTNEEFNMAFSKQKSTKQAKLRHQYNILSKVNLNNKTRDEKLQHRRKKKEIKQLLAIQQKKRLDLINEQQKQYHFIKLLSNTIRINCQFDEKEIFLAKKCKLNKLNQPPNYELPQIAIGQKDQSKSMKSFSFIKNAKEESEVNPNIDDFSMIENIVEPLQRSDNGIWIKDVDFLACFTNLQIIYNPAAFEHKTIEKIVASNSKALTFDQNKQILVVEKVELNEEGLQAQGINLLVGFSYQQNFSEQDYRPYCILQKFDFDQFSVTSNITTLSNKIDSNLLTLKNQNNVFKIYPICKGNYNYWISSNAKFRLMSISEYLQEFQGYKKKSFTVEYPPLQGKSYFALSRFNLKEGSEEKNSVLLKIVSQNPQLVKNSRYNLVKAPQQGEKYISLEKQGIIQRVCQKKLLAIDYTKITIDSHEQYALILECCPSENTAEGSCQIIALIKNETLSFQLSQQVQPLKFIEKYKPNKYGLVFKERVFSNAATKQGFLVKLVEGEEVQGGSGGAGKAAKKGGKQQVGVQYVQKPLQQQRTIILRVLRNRQILYEAIGKNWVSISDVCFPNLKQKSNEQYFLQGYFDLRQWPQASQQSQDTSKLCWTITVFGTDSLALVRDTKQEQKQKQTRKSWQDKEVGRAERAKKSRRRFLIMLKKENGQKLTEQQQQLLGAPRLTKKQQIEQEKKNQDKNKKGGKKQEKKGGKQVKKEQVQQKPAKIVFPKSVDNCNYEIKSFLKTLQNFSVKKNVKPENVQEKIRSQQQLKAIKESQKQIDEDRVGMLQRNVERRQTIKLKQRDKKDQLSLYLQELNRQFKQAWSKYIAWRNEDLQKDKSKQEKERTLIEVLKQQKPTISEVDLDKILNQYRETQNYSERLYDVGVMLKKNIKIGGLSQKISNHLVGWQIQQLKVINQQIKNQKIEGIQENILKDVKSMLEEAEKNPGIAQEKQNEAKKAKKGGKK